MSTGVLTYRVCVVVQSQCATAVPLWPGVPAARDVTKRLQEYSDTIYLVYSSC